MTAERPTTDDERAELVRLRSEVLKLFKTEARLSKTQVALDRQLHVSRALHALVLELIDRAPPETIGAGITEFATRQLGYGKSVLLFRPVGASTLVVIGFDGYETAGSVARLRQITVHPDDPLLSLLARGAVMHCEAAPIGEIARLTEALGLGEARAFGLLADGAPRGLLLAGNEDGNPDGNTPLSDEAAGQGLQSLATQAAALLKASVDRQKIEQMNVRLRQHVEEVERAEGEAREAEEAAREANRAKSVFLAKMSHELRTPLNAIIGYSEMLKEDASDPVVRRDVERIETSARHLLRILSDILDLTKIEIGRLELRCEVVRVEGLVAEVVDTVQGAVAAAGNRLVVVVDPAASAVSADRGRLGQVLINLLVNASKFTDQGEITLRVTRDPDAPSRIWFRVSDTGIGIPTDQVVRLFHPFIQVDESSTRRYDGVGLGLAISKQLTEQMCGVIEVESTPGVGSTFSVGLPVPA